MGVPLSLRGHEHQRRNPAPSRAVLVTEKQGRQYSTASKTSKELKYLWGADMILPWGHCRPKPFCLSRRTSLGLNLMTVREFVLKQEGLLGP